jgi:hypothetical protein
MQNSLLGGKMRGGSMPVGAPLDDPAVGGTKAGSRRRPDAAEAEGARVGQVSSAGGGALLP